MPDIGEMGSTDLPRSLSSSTRSSVPETTVGTYGKSPSALSVLQDGQVNLLHLTRNFGLYLTKLLQQHQSTHQPQTPGDRSMIWEDWRLDLIQKLTWSAFIDAAGDCSITPQPSRYGTPMKMTGGGARRVYCQSASPVRRRQPIVEEHLIWTTPRKTKPEPALVVEQSTTEGQTQSSASNTTALVDLFDISIPSRPSSPPLSSSTRQTPPSSGRPLTRTSSHLNTPQPNPTLKLRPTPAPSSAASMKAVEKPTQMFSPVPVPSAMATFPISPAAAALRFGTSPSSVTPSSAVSSGFNTPIRFKAHTKSTPQAEPVKASPAATIESKVIVTAPTPAAEPPASSPIPPTPPRRRPISQASTPEQQQKREQMKRALSTATTPATGPTSLHIQQLMARVTGVRDQNKAEMELKGKIQQQQQQQQWTPTSSTPPTPSTQLLASPQLKVNPTQPPMPSSALPVPVAARSQPEPQSTPSPLVDRSHPPLQPTSQLVVQPAAQPVGFPLPAILFSPVAIADDLNQSLDSTTSDSDDDAHTYLPNATLAALLAIKVTDDHQLVMRAPSPTSIPAKPYLNSSSTPTTTITYSTSTSTTTTTVSAAIQSPLMNLSRTSSSTASTPMTPTSIQRPTYDRHRYADMASSLVEIDSDRSVSDEDSEVDSSPARVKKGVLKSSGLQSQFNAAATKKI